MSNEKLEMPVRQLIEPALKDKLKLGHRPFRAGFRSQGTLPGMVAHHLYLTIFEVRYLASLTKDFCTVFAIRLEMQEFSIWQIYRSNMAVRELSR
ncbi:hypothetical protein [Pseudorhodoferax soli]|uniref:hypothetical protein n=1 Tax=Pseudorhodoferax soli TaxID=545864 RepID=UPI001FE44E48|nr:hypothetical protein [Pseudorhodoferax soli]